MPLAGFLAGASAGTFLHEVFELFDFQKLHPGLGAESPDGREMTGGGAFPDGPEAREELETTEGLETIEGLVSSDALEATDGLETTEGLTVEDGLESGRRELAALVNMLLARHGFAQGRWRDLLVAGLEPVLQTPLGGPLGETRLCDIPMDKRLDELHFHLPVAGGSAWVPPGPGDDDGGGEPVRSGPLAAAFGKRPGYDFIRQA